MKFKITNVVPSERVTEEVPGKSYRVSRDTPYLVTSEAAQNRVKATFTVEIDLYRSKQKKYRHKTFEELQREAEFKLKRFCAELAR